MKKKLPTGISTFSEIITDGYVYVDKTRYIHTLIDCYKYVFLSRPRRFGKSLTIDTIDEIFSANKELFAGLWIQDQRDWSKRYPVVRLDFGKGKYDSTEGFEAVIAKSIEMTETRYDISVGSGGLLQQFQSLLFELKKKTGNKCVILIDEYDKPILDNIDTNKLTLMRDELRSFYSTIKGCDADIKFAMMTGVTKFAKTSVFSGPNNFDDVSLTPAFGMLCGYTEDELTSNFADFLKTIDRKEMKKWYNGYNFLGTETVYNPYGTLKFLRDQRYENYRFVSGTPTFLIKVLQQQTYFQTIYQLENCKLPESQLNKFEIDNIAIESLLLQAGYLTIASQETMLGRISYRLMVPNFEVKTSLNDIIIADYFGLPHAKKSIVQEKLYETINSGDIAGFITQIDILFASISYTNYINNDICTYEGFYSSVVYTMLYATGFDIVAEDITSEGRIDLTILRNNNAFIIEFKVEQSGFDALTQIKTKNYAAKYTNCQKVFLVGINFDKETRKVDNRETETIG